MAGAEDVAVIKARLRIWLGQVQAVIAGRIRGNSRRRGRTSITEDVAYLEFCKRAAEEATVFQVFRREPVYVRTLEHVSEQQGAEYLRIIQRDNPQLIAEYVAYGRANDKLGHPTTYVYPGIGRISPVTLRYMKVLSDLEMHFGDLTGKHVIEIGVGYGGQAALVLRRWRLRSYILVDLEAPLALARRYLAALGIDGGPVFITPDELGSGDYDLCISNYAFSELSRDVQELYARLAVRSSSRGYLTCNFIGALHGIDTWSKDEIGQVRPDSHWVREEPLTYRGNEILIWGDENGQARPNRAPDR